MFQPHEENSRNAKPALQFARCAGFVRKDDGSAAVEFGMVAAPFLLLVFAIMETAIVFFAGQALETAVANSARLIMTGQAQTQGFDQAAFKNAVCGKIYGLFNCASGVYVDVKTYTIVQQRRSHVRRSTPTETSRTTRPTSPAARATSWWCGCSTNGRSTCRR